MGIGGLSVYQEFVFGLGYVEFPDLFYLLFLFYFASSVIYKQSTSKTIAGLNLFLHLYVTCKLCSIISSSWCHRICEGIIVKPYLHILHMLKHERDKLYSMFLKIIINLLHVWFRNNFWTHWIQRKGPIQDLF